MAASVLLALLGITWWMKPSLFGGWERYATAIGEQRTIELEDGSVLQLNTQSRVQVRIDERSREVRLTQGEALFKVAHDTVRPFRVHTGDVVIRAVGTQFNVYRRPSDVSVAVVEGEATRERRYGGTFDADDPDSFVQFVTSSGQLVAERQGSRIVIR